MINQTVKDSPLRVGISSCLLGEKVRFDGGHKKDRYLTDILGNYFEWVPVCPELEVGMGIPREAVRLTGDHASPRMIGVKSETDWTERMVRYSERRIRQLAELNLSGCILKSDSPSCGMERVKIYSKGGMPMKNGRGNFTDVYMKGFPLVPVEEEGRLNDAKIRENFITRVFAYHRLQNLLTGKFSRGELVKFHTINKYLMLAHSPKHYDLLGRVVANAKRKGESELKETYGNLLMEGLKVKTTTKKNVNVLHHILGFLRGHLIDSERKDILEIIEDYHKELVPLIVPLTLVRHYIRKYGVEYISNQVYLNPHPKELMLRNHV